MSAALKLLLYALVLGPLILGGLFVERHPDWLRRQFLAFAGPSGDVLPAPAPVAQQTSLNGRHPLTDSPPVTVPDLDRLVSVGFATDQIVSEIERRGVLSLPDSSELARIQALPGGSRLLDAMEAPKNLLDDAAIARFGRRQAGQDHMDQIRNAARATAMLQAGMPVVNSAQQQMQADYQRRRSALSAQLASLQQKRTAMQRRGESTITITMEIEHLQRERDALVAPF